jgi:hypothetical protein
VARVNFGGLTVAAGNRHQLLTPSATDENRVIFDDSSPSHRKLGFILANNNSKLLVKRTRSSLTLFARQTLHMIEVVNDHEG